MKPGHGQRAHHQHEKHYHSSSHHRRCVGRNPTETARNQFGHGATRHTPPSTTFSPYIIPGIPHTSNTNKWLVEMRHACRTTWYLSWHLSLANLPPRRTHTYRHRGRDTVTSVVSRTQSVPVRLSRPGSSSSSRSSLYVQSASLYDTYRKTCIAPHMRAS